MNFIDYKQISDNAGIQTEITLDKYFNFIIGQWWYSVHTADGQYFIFGINDRSNTRHFYYDVIQTVHHASEGNVKCTKYFKVQLPYPVRSVLVEVKDSTTVSACTLDFYMKKND